MPWRKWRKHAEKIAETFYTGFHSSVFCSDCRAFGHIKYLAVTGMQDGMLERIYQMEVKKEPDAQAQGEQVPKEEHPPESTGLFAGPLKPEGEFSPEAQAMNRFFVIYYNCSYCSCNS